MTLTEPTNSPSRRLTRDVSMVVPSKSTYGWPCAELTFTSGARFASVSACCAAGTLDGTGELFAEGVPVVAAGGGADEAAPGIVSLPETRFDAKRALQASAFSASAI